MACQAGFTVVRRRHHCRNCGKVFCGRCSSNNVPLPRYGHTKPVRVCNRCFLYQVTPFTVSPVTPASWALKQRGVWRGWMIENESFTWYFKMLGPLSRARGSLHPFPFLLTITIENSYLSRFASLKPALYVETWTYVSWNFYQFQFTFAQFTTWYVESCGSRCLVILRYWIVRNKKLKISFGRKFISCKSIFGILISASIQVHCDTDSPI